MDYKDFEYAYELEDLAAKTPFCKDCAREEKAASSTDSSSSTETEQDMEDEAKVERRETRILTKMMVQNLEKQASLERKAVKRQRAPSPIEDLEEGKSDGFGSMRNETESEVNRGPLKDGPGDVPDL